jgi:hypothetical protein
MHLFFCLFVLVQLAQGYGSGIRPQPVALLEKKDIVAPIALSKISVFGKVNESFHSLAQKLRCQRMLAVHSSFHIDDNSAKS